MVQKITESGKYSPSNAIPIFILFQILYSMCCYQHVAVRFYSITCAIKWIEIEESEILNCINAIKKRNCQYGMSMNVRMLSSRWMELILSSFLSFFYILGVFVSFGIAYYKITAFPIRLK